MGHMGAGCMVLHQASEILFRSLLISCLVIERAIAPRFVSCQRTASCAALRSRLGFAPKRRSGSPCYRHRAVNSHSGNASYSRTDVLLAIAVATSLERIVFVTDESALIHAAQGGDRASFGELYSRYSRMIHGILLAKVPRSEVDDLMQDVFLSAMNRMAGLRDARSFGGWLAMIARNRAIDWYRQNPQLAELPDNLPAHSAPVSEAARALAAVRELPEAYRETLVLRLVEGMTGQEISERTGLTPESVRVNLHRGMKMLREKLGMEARP